jgi:surfeit locus 1 family protein
MTAVDERPRGTRLESGRFPFGLTIGALAVIAICAALGVWQLGRAQWKAVELKRIAALKSAAPQPIGPVLARDAAGRDQSFARVAVTCAPGSAQAAYKLVADNGDWIARARAACRLPAGGPYDALLIDRGVLVASRGLTNGPATVLPPPAEVVGVLYHQADALPSDAHPAPYVLVAEHETPAPPGVTPTPYPDAASNLEYVGAYAPTWFGLAVVALCFYAALLWRRYHPKR